MYDPEDYPEHRALGSRARRWADPCCNQELGPLLFEIPDERQPLEAPLVSGFNVHPSRFRPPEEVESLRSKGPTRIDNSSPPPDDGDPPEAGELPVDSALARWGGDQRRSRQDEWLPEFEPVYGGPLCRGSTRPFHIRGKGLGGFAGEDTQLDRTIEDFMRLFQVPNATIGILSSDQRLVCAKAYSLEGVTHPVNEPVVIATPNTLFRIGSLSKLITVYMSLLAIESGLIQDTTRAGDVLPYLMTPALQSATLEQLLRHTSGLSNRGLVDSDGDPLWPANYWPPTGPASGVTIADLMNSGCFPITREQEILYADRFLALANFGQPPDIVGRALYSSFGIDLAGEMVATAFGMPFEAVCQFVFAHLDMNQTRVGTYALERYPDEVLYYPNFPKSVRDQVRPHCGDALLTWNPYDRNLTKALPSGGWTSTPVDLLRFTADLVQSSLDGGGVLSKETVTKMWDTTYDAYRPGGGLRNTLVWRVDTPPWRTPSSSGRHRWHTGGMDGVTAALYLYPRRSGGKWFPDLGAMDDGAVVFAMNRSRSAPERLFGRCSARYRAGTNANSAYYVFLGKIMADIIPNTFSSWKEPGNDLFDMY